MPELPDIAAYLAALEPRILSRPLERVFFFVPFLPATHASSTSPAALGSGAAPARA